MIRIHLSRLLGEQRWSQADLARRTGIRPATINEWYHGFVDRISVTHIDRLCEALDCSVDELIEYVPNRFKTTGREVVVEFHGNRRPKE